MLLDTRVPALTTFLSEQSMANEIKNEHGLLEN